MSKKLSVYLSGGWLGRDNLLDYKNLLENEYDIKVYCSWISRDSNDNNPDTLLGDSMIDILEIDNSDIMVVFMESPSFAYRNSFSKIGCAIGQNKKIIIVCPGRYIKTTKTKCKYEFYCMRVPIFWHPLIYHSTNIEESIKILLKLNKELN